MSKGASTLPFQEDDSGDISMASRSQTPMSTDSDETSSEDEIMESKPALSGVFDLVTAELLKIGAIPLERFEMEDNPQEDNVPTEQFSAIKSSDGQGFKSGAVTTVKGRHHFQAVAKIYEACMRTFESSEAIHFDYKQDLGPQSKPFLIQKLRETYSLPKSAQLLNAF
jgi:hypothetical protein